MSHLTVPHPNRLARSLPHLIETVTQSEKSGAGLRSLTKAIDTMTPAVGSCSTCSPPSLSSNATLFANAYAPALPLQPLAAGVAAENPSSLPIGWSAPKPLSPKGPAWRENPP